MLSWESIQQTAETSLCVQVNRQNQCDLESTGRIDWFLPTVSRLPSTMADNVNEESDYNPGKDELDWGYEEGKLVFISMWRDAGKYVMLAGK